MVAVKVLKVSQSSDLGEIKRVGHYPIPPIVVLIPLGQGFCKEVMLWKNLCHPNVLPLLGAIMDNTRFAMISQWMNNGNINEFLKENCSENRFELVGPLPAVNCTHH